MKKFKILILIAVIFFLCCSYPTIYRMSVGKMNYFEELGIFTLMNNDIPPVSQKNVDAYTYKYYDGITLVYCDNSFIRAEITKNTFKLDKGITIGSDRDFVEFLYKNQTRIIDVEDNEYGFVNKSLTYVLFQFDELNKTKKIIISMGP